MLKRNFSYLPSGQKLDLWVDANRDPVEDPAGVEGDPLVIVVVLLLELCLEFLFELLFEFLLDEAEGVVKGTWEC